LIRLAPCIYQTQRSTRSYQTGLFYRSLLIRLNKKTGAFFSDNPGNRHIDLLSVPNYMTVVPHAQEGIIILFYFVMILYERRGQFAIAFRVGGLYGTVSSVFYLGGGRKSSLKKSSQKNSTSEKTRQIIIYWKDERRSAVSSNRESNVPVR